MPEELYKKNVSEAGPSGLHTDNNPIDQPKGTYRFALNAVEETSDGYQNRISNEKANYPSGTFPIDYLPIGERYIEDDTSSVILVNPKTNKQLIGLITKDNKYSTTVDTAVLGLKITNQCDIIYRLRRGGERVIYWVDSLNRARTFNYDRPHNFYNEVYKAYLRGGGNPATYVGEKWDVSSFDLIKTYKSIPSFSNVEILETGNILAGSYNFAIQYVDEDLNPTEWITTSNTVNIYNDSTTNPYGRIRGSRNVQSDAQNFPRTNKSVKLTFSNLDNNFPYYRVAIICANGNTGQPNKVYAADLSSTSESTFIYSGNDSNLADINLADILIEKEVIFAPKHIEQIENRLLLANAKGKGLNWCEFQKYASKISSDLTTKAVLLNNINSEPNVKNVNSTFFYRGYMPGEVYSFGICYILDDGTITPVFTIPGKNITNTTSLMKYHELSVANRYLDIHNCSVSSYWGVDSTGDTLTGKRARHNRFPFRHEVNKPLVTTNTSAVTTTKYRIQVKFALATGKTFPVDTNGDPIAISFIFNYIVDGVTYNYSGTLTDDDISNQTITIIYDDVDQPTAISGPDYLQLDSTSQLATYMPSGNETFVITQTQTSYIANTSYDNDQSEIFGIEFSNIEKPHADVIGFYIVRNERTDDDKLIIDNAVLGTMTEFQQYKSFGLLMPKQFYSVNNCGTSANPSKTISFFNKGLWFYSPEHQYFHKKIEFDEVVLEGAYTETSYEMPTISDTAGSTCNDGGSKGIYISDVQAGTSFNPDIDKGSDDDGFDMIIGYRNTNVAYSLSTVGIVIPAKDRVIYLNAASYQNYNNSTYYNVSVDSKIGMLITASPIAPDTLHNSGTNQNRLAYGSLVKNSDTSYSNYMNRPYYKEHNNPILFNNNTIVNNIKIFNGDAQISATNIISSTYSNMVVANRPKKSGVCKTIIGAVLVVAAVVATVLTGGAAAPLAVVAIGALAVSYGVTLIVSGIKMEQLKEMLTVDYEKGLKETVTDGGVYETVRDSLSSADDTIRWFCDRISNIYIESSVPFGLRTGLTGGVTDFVDAPMQYGEDSFRYYLIEKLTVVDRNQGSGRLYKGYAGAEVYDMNKDYMRFNKEKSYIHLPLEYDCCSDDKEQYGTRWWWSQQSFQEEKTDNYRAFLPNNYKDIEGEHGEITDLYTLGGNLFICTKESRWRVPKNNQERVTGEIISFIGTGEFFSIPPIKLLDDNLGSGGTQHKWATIKTNKGIISINEIESKVHVHTDGLKDISEEGNRSWFKNNLVSYLSTQYYNRLGVNYPYDNNTASPFGVGYLGTYDTRYDRVILTKKDYLYLGDWTKVKGVYNPRTVYHIGDIIIDDSGWHTITGITYSVLGFQQLTLSGISFEDVTKFENKSWTISYSMKSGKWISWHSYLPNFYISSQNSFYSFIASSNNVWKHNMEGKFQTYYGIYYPHYIEIVQTSPIQDVITEDITIQTRARKWSPTSRQYLEDNLTTYNTITAYNTKQNSGEQNIVVKPSQPSPELWYEHQVQNVVGDVIASRNENNWNINDLRDYVVSSGKPFFTSSWANIQGSYYIDKVIDTSVINFSKAWHELESFRDKFIIVRLKFSIFDDVNLILNYNLTTEQNSVK